MFRSLSIALCAAGLATSMSAQTALPRSTPAAINEQIAQLAAGAPVARAFAACILAEMGRRASAAVPALVRLLADATPIDPVVCRSELGLPTIVHTPGKTSPGFEAARALGAIGDAALDPLLETARSDNRDVRRHAARALGAIRSERSVAALATMARDPDRQVRAEAAEGLGRQRDSNGLEPLRRLATDPEADVRQNAIRGLGQLRDRAVLDIVAAAVTDPDERVRLQAVIALGRVDGPRQGDALTVTAVVTALGDSSPWVRERAARVAGNTRDPRVLPALIPLLKDSDPDVREEAVTALGRLSTPQAAESLIAALKDQDAGVRERAAQALGRLQRTRR